MKLIEWLLLTIAHGHAERLLIWCSRRWPLKARIRESHVEDLQLETRGRLERSITLYSIVAWRLLWMTYQVWVDPNQLPTTAFSAAEIAALEQLAATQEPARQPRQPFMLRCGPSDSHTRWVPWPKE